MGQAGTVAGLEVEGAVPHVHALPGAQAEQAAALEDRTGIGLVGGTIVGTYEQVERTIQAERGQTAQGGLVALGGYHARDRPLPRKSAISSGTPGKMRMRSSCTRAL